MAPSSVATAVLPVGVLCWSAARKVTPQDAVSEAPTIAARIYLILDMRSAPVRSQ